MPTHQEVIERLVAERDQAQVEAAALRGVAARAVSEANGVLAENTRLRAALAWYANAANWAEDTGETAVVNGVGASVMQVAAVWEDCGERARQALADGAASATP